MVLTRLLYISRALVASDSAEMARIGEIANSRNAASDVTGFLYHDDKSFLQVLEGPAEAVSEIFRAIEADRRHEQVRVLEHVDISQRQFTDWAMGLYDGSVYSGLLRLAFGEQFIETLAAESSGQMLGFLRDLSRGDDQPYRMA